MRPKKEFETNRCGRL